MKVLALFTFNFECFFHILYEADRLQQLSFHMEMYVDDFFIIKIDVSHLKITTSIKNV